MVTQGETILLVSGVSSGVVFTISAPISADRDYYCEITLSEDRLPNGTQKIYGASKLNALENAVGYVDRMIEHAETELSFGG